MQVEAGTYLFQGYFMKTQIKLDAIYAASSDVVVRKVAREIIIIPFASGVDDAENEPYFLNATGQVIWQRLDGRRSLKDIVTDLAAEFNAPVKVVKKDVIVFMETLLMKKMIAEVYET